MRASQLQGHRLAPQSLPTSSLRQSTASQALDSGKWEALCQEFMQALPLNDGQLDKDRLRAIVKARCTATDRDEYPEALNIFSAKARTVLASHPQDAIAQKINAFVQEEMATFASPSNFQQETPSASAPICENSTPSRAPWFDLAPAPQTRAPQTPLRTPQTQLRAAQAQKVASPENGPLFDQIKGGCQKLTFSYLYTRPTSNEKKFGGTTAYFRDQYGGELHVHVKKAEESFCNYENKRFGVLYMTISYDFENLRNTDNWKNVVKPQIQLAKQSLQTKF